MEKPVEQRSSVTSAAPGFAVIGCMITGVYGLVHTGRTGDSNGLVAAAIAFGIVVYTTLR